MSQWQIRERSLGNMYIADGDDIATNVATGATFVKLAGTTTAGLLHNFVHTNGRLTYTGPNRWFAAMAVLTISTNQNGGIIHTQWDKNGVLMPESEQHRKVGSAGDLGNMSCPLITELVAGDYLELWTTTELNQDSKTITAEHYYVTIR